MLYKYKTKDKNFQNNKKNSSSPPNKNKMDKCLIIIFKLLYLKCIWIMLKLKKYI